jgi:hypothetical protein
LQQTIHFTLKDDANARYFTLRSRRKNKQHNRSVVATGLSWGILFQNGRRNETHFADLPEAISSITEIE